MKRRSILFVFLMATTVLDAETLKAIHASFRLVVSEGSEEAASVGTYHLRIDRIITPKDLARSEPITSLVHARNGKLQKAWLVDLDHEGVLEVLIWTVSAGSGSYGTLDLFTFDGKALKEEKIVSFLEPHLQVSEIPSDLGTEYQYYIDRYLGHDVFSIDQGTMTRRFLLNDDKTQSHAEAIVKNKTGQLILVKRKDSWRWEVPG